MIAVLQLNLLVFYMKQLLNLLKLCQTSYSQVKLDKLPSKNFDQHQHLIQSLSLFIVITTGDIKFLLIRSKLITYVGVQNYGWEFPKIGGRSSPKRCLNETLLVVPMLWELLGANNAYVGASYRID